jgi:hypothetical protein
MLCLHYLHETHPNGLNPHQSLYHFSKAIKDGSFTVDDIGIANGIIHSDSFTKVSETQYTELESYPINKSLRLRMSAFVFILVLPSVKSVIVSLPAFLKP